MLLQQRLPLAVLKLEGDGDNFASSSVKLQQRLPLAVLKLMISKSLISSPTMLQQRLPLAVLKQTRI